MKTPNKYQNKGTTTEKLRDDINEVLKSFRLATYLEVGIAHSYTSISLSSNFESGLGIDINPKNIIQSQKNLDKHGVTNFRIIEGTVDDLLPAAYEVVFLDANHDYKNVRYDFMKIMNRNTASTFHVFFHDYGLKGAGVKQFVHEVCEFAKIEPVFCGEDGKDYNPKGQPVDGPECAMITIDPKVWWTIVDKFDK